jgi:gliding motility-associated-like protein
LVTDNPICREETTVLAALNSSDTYLWQPGNSTDAQLIVTADQTTTYTLIQTNQNLCSTIQTIEVRVAQPLLPFITAEKTEICEGEKTTLTANPGTSFRWQPGNLVTDKIEIQPTETTEYTVTVTNLEGCESTATQVISVKPAQICYGLEIPNVFSPNNDGVNNTFEIRTIYNQLLFTEIYDRWGNLIWTTREENLFWDGNVNSVPAPEGVYVYRLTFRNRITDEKIEKAGTLTLIR